MRFTPAITQVVNLIPTDVGRPIGDIVQNILGYDRLIEGIKEVLQKLTPKETEVQTRDGRGHLMRIRPYRTLENVIKGAVVTFTDITELKRAREKLKESDSMVHRLAVVVRDSNDAITLQDMEGRILAWNPSAERIIRLERRRGYKDEFQNLDPQGSERRRTEYGEEAQPG